jgi:uncharacterized protein YukE
MSLPCSVCKKSVVKDPVKCKICGTAVAHPSCAGKARPTGLWSCAGCRSDTNSVGSQRDSESGDPLSISDQLASLEANLTSQIGALSGRFKETEDAISFYSAKYDEFLKQVTEQNKLIGEMKKALERVNEKLREKDATINQLTARVNQLEQSNLSTNIEIHGIPQGDRENVLEVLQNLADQVGAPRVSETVADAFRMPGRPPRAANDTPRAPIIVVKLKVASAKMAWLAGRRRLQRPQQQGDDVTGAPSNAAAAAATQPGRRGPPPVRIYEQHTPYNKRLLFLTRAAATEKGFKFVWVREGKIFARKNEQLAALIRIRCEDDIRTKMGHIIATTHI